MTLSLSLSRSLSGEDLHGNFPELNTKSPPPILSIPKSSQSPSALRKEFLEEDGERG